MTERLLRLVLSLLLLTTVCCGGSNATTPLKEIQRTRAGEVDVLLLSPSDAIRQGKDSFVLEFRRGGALVDVGTVTANATMPMAGMGPMLGKLDATPGDAAGRYVVSSDLSMAGSWRFTMEWDGPAGKGTASLPGVVR
jgi:hypothetical protein